MTDLEYMARAGLAAIREPGDAVILRAMTSDAMDIARTIWRAMIEAMMEDRK